MYLYTYQSGMYMYLMYMYISILKGIYFSFVPCPSFLLCNIGKVR